MPRKENKQKRGHQATTRRVPEEDSPPAPPPVETIPPTPPIYTIKILEMDGQTAMVINTVPVGEVNHLLEQKIEIQAASVLDFYDIYRNVGEDYYYVLTRKLDYKARSDIGRDSDDSETDKESYAYTTKKPFVYKGICNPKVNWEEVVHRLKEARFKLNTNILRLWRYTKAAIKIDVNVVLPPNHSGEHDDREDCTLDGCFGPEQVMPPGITFRILEVSPKFTLHICKMKKCATGVDRPICRNMEDRYGEGAVKQIEAFNRKLFILNNVPDHSRFPFGRCVPGKMATATQSGWFVLEDHFPASKRFFKANERDLSTLLSFLSLMHKYEQDIAKKEIQKYTTKLEDLGPVDSGRFLRRMQTSNLVLHVKAATRFYDSEAYRKLLRNASTLCKMPQVVSYGGGINCDTIKLNMDTVSNALCIAGLQLPKNGLVICSLGYDALLAYFELSENWSSAGIACLAEKYIEILGNYEICHGVDAVKMKFYFLLLAPHAAMSAIERRLIENERDHIDGYQKKNNQEFVEDHAKYFVNLIKLVQRVAKHIPPHVLNIMSGTIPQTATTSL